MSVNCCRSPTRKLSTFALNRAEAGEQSGNGAGKACPGVQEYRKVIKMELETVHNDIIELVDNWLLTEAVSGESKMFYFTLKCSNADNAAKAYKEAKEGAFVHLTPTPPLLWPWPKAFDDAIAGTLLTETNVSHLTHHTELNTVSEDSYKGSTMIMQLLCDKLYVVSWEDHED
ncbi:14-3-3 protein [Penicillium subrubescens]|uniref:14-3-3 protein n=1 Tax=Penicillium subrubescens TaxID=1316194 RepID=UPI00254570AA|nr:14-3-3 protein [Penicillium subrubescens]KAJ5904956.1 14-3-3 protein [Penicillium subrubescens]